MSTRSPGATSTRRSLSVVQPLEVATLQILEAHCAAGRFDELDAVFVRAEFVHRNHRLAGARRFSPRPSASPADDVSDAVGGWTSDHFPRTRAARSGQYALRRSY